MLGSQISDLWRAQTSPDLIRGGPHGTGSMHRNLGILTPCAIGILGICVVVCLAILGTRDAALHPSTDSTVTAVSETTEIGDPIEGANDATASQRRPIESLVSERASTRDALPTADSAATLRRLWGEIEHDGQPGIPQGLSIKCYEASGVAKEAHVEQEGLYEFVDVDPGLWKLTAWSPRSVYWESMVSIPDDVGSVRCDISLNRVVRLPIEVNLADPKSTDTRRDFQLLQKASMPIRAMGTFEQLAQGRLVRTGDAEADHVTYAAQVATLSRSREIVGFIYLVDQEPLWVSLVCNGYVLESQWVNPVDTRRVVFTVEPAMLLELLSSITLVVTDSETGTSLPRSRVGFSAEAGGWDYPVDASGRVTAHRIPPGPLRITAYKQGWATHEMTIQVAESSKLDLGVIALGRGVRVRGSVIDKRGHAHSGVDVEFTGADMPRSSISHGIVAGGTQSDENGVRALLYRLAVETGLRSRHAKIVNLSRNRGRRHSVGRKRGV